MNKNTKIMLGIITFLIIIAIVLFGFVFKEMNSSKTTSENSGSTTSLDTGNSNTSSTSSGKITPIETSTKLSVSYTTAEENGTYTNYTAKVNLNYLSVDGSGVTISGTTIKITSAGTYYFSGTASDASITVEADKNAEVILVFDNANITSSNTAVINGVKAKSITINLKEGSTNTFTDSSSYTVFTEDDEPNATVFSKTDLIVNGSGKLIINANYEDGIASKDTLKIINTNIEITSKDDGIRGKDFVAIKNSNITIKSSGDGIKSTNTDTALGYIIIEGGTININSASDGIQAENILNISESNITIKTTGNINAKTSDGDTVSSKGLKAGVEITINSGTININSTDDSIHSNKYVIINGGVLNLTSGDDGIHADNNILINDGTINITKSYEGIESSYIKINGGNISLVASDDGINIAGGNDGSGFGRTGANSFTSSNSGRELVINGGTIKVVADGDGLDSNGSITITGGNTTVFGAVNGGNGALDYDESCTVTGGGLIFYGANGMWQNPTTSSTQYTIAFSKTGSAGDTIELKDSNGNTIVSFTASKAYGMIGISNSNLKQGETYTLYVNGTSYSSQTITSIITTNGSTSGGMMQGGGRIQNFR